MTIEKTGFVHIISLTKSAVYDIVVGPVADDDMTMLFRQYQNEIITFENLISGMTFRKTTNQYSFHTERAVALLRKVGVFHD